MAAKMISVEEARARVLAEASPLGVEVRSLTDTLGLVLAEDIVAESSIPPFDNSAMDGFALRAADTVDATPEHPVVLRISQVLAAGHVAAGPLCSGEAVKIMTGAPVPEGADTIVQSELVEEDGSRVRILEPVKPGQNIRRAGEDARAGDCVLAAGSVLGPAEIGLFAGLGRPFVSVHRVPRVAIVSTGSELVEIDQPLGPGQIHNSNGYSIWASCRQMGVEATALGIVPDDYEATRRLVERGLDYDVLLTTGGVSVGQFDLVKDVQDDLGVERRLWGVSMKPGRPVAFGVRGKTLVFGLPGNPASAMVSFELFVRPALLRLMGHRKTTKPLYRAIMNEDVAGSDSRLHIIRVRAWRENGAWHVSSTGAQGSAGLRSMVGVNGLAFISGGSPMIRAGEEVDFLLLKEELQEP